MKNAITAELKKLFTVRSTYLILCLVLILVCFFGFYVVGWRIEKADLLNPYFISHNFLDAISTISIFSALAGLLLVTHEYRYNTITYALTLSNSRSKVLASKILVMTGFALVFTAFYGVLSILVTYLGLRAHGFHLVHQTLQYNNVIWRSLFYGWGYTMAGLVIAVLVRNQVGAIVTLFIVPATVEGLLSLILKNNTVYLPFSALSTVVGRGMNFSNAITPLHAAYVFSGYLIVAWIVAWYLFLKKDAN